MLRSIRTIRNIPRLKDITFVLVRHGLHQMASALGAPIALRVQRLWRRPFSAPLSQIERLRLAFQELGPTFIKLGQLIANRPDVFPAGFVEEFSKLEDRVTPLPFKDMHAALAAALHGDPARYFRRIDENALASASMAQVHRAALLDGTEVVLKIQKPGIEAVIERDFEILALIAEALSKWEELQFIDPGALVAEARRAIERELNFTFERNAMERVRAAFDGDKVLVVPRSYGELSSRRLLVMDYLEGTPLRRSTATGAEAERIARECTRILFEMIFRDGHFHADPHASNIMHLEDGRLAWVDFGSTGVFTDEMRDRLVRLVKALVARDYGAVARQVMRLGRARGESSMMELTQDIAARLDPYFGLTLKEVDIAALFKTILDIARDHRIVIAAEFMLMTRCLILIEGVVHTLAPQFNTMREVEPLLRRHLLERLHPGRAVETAVDRVVDAASMLAEVPTSAVEILRKLAQGRLQIDSHVEGLEKATRRIEHCTNHIVQALLASSLLVGSSLLLAHDVGPRIWGFPALGLIGYIGAALFGIWILLALLRR